MIEWLVSVCVYMQLLFLSFAHSEYELSNCAANTCIFALNVPHGKQGYLCVSQ